MLVKVNERRPRGEIIVDEFQARHIMVSRRNWFPPTMRAG